MNSRSIFAFAILSLVAAQLAATIASAQEPLQPRRLAPGVLITVPASAEVGESFTGPMKLKDFKPEEFSPNFTPKTETLFERSKHVTLRRAIWSLEFTFKPLRMIEADIPQPDGRMKKKVIWYLLYKLRNPGGAIMPKGEEVPLPDGSSAEDPNRLKFTPEIVNDLDPAKVTMPYRFYPIFVLEGWVQDPITKQYTKIPYTDRIIPSAIPQIRAKEDPAIPLYNSVQLQKFQIPLSDADNDKSIWGVATWEDIDPRVDYVSVFIQGLTNAFRFYELADGKRVYHYKTLQLNFWRPGDARDETEDQIRYGVPLVSNPIDQIRIFGFYGVPGPSIAAYEYFPTTRRESFLFRIDAQLDPEYQSTLRVALNSGTFSPAVRQGFADAGLTIAGDPTLGIVIDGDEWRFVTDIDGESREFRLRYEPQYWEKVKEGLDVKERVDHFWIYR